MARVSKAIELIAYLPDGDRLVFPGKDLVSWGVEPEAGVTPFFVTKAYDERIPIDDKGKRIPLDSDGNPKTIAHHVEDKLLEGVFDVYRGIPFRIREDQSGSIEMPDRMPLVRQ